MKRGHWVNKQINYVNTAWCDFYTYDTLFLVSLGVNIAMKIFLANKSGYETIKLILARVSVNLIIWVS